MSLPVKSIKELVELAKSKPGQFNFGSSGIGGTSHLLGEILKLSGQIDIVHVPYKGTSLIVPDLLEGRMHLMFSAVPSAVIPHFKAGKLRILGVAGETRYRGLPEVPTFVEAGFPSLNITPWYGFVAPAGTPKGTVTKLNTEITKILDMSDVKGRLMQAGLDPRSNTPEEFAIYIKKDVAMWAKVIKDSGIPVH
jgi:tripartite-type tricarboxylate transporter receptor subunit TctC